MIEMDKNYNFYMKTDLDSYIGEWVAICDEKIVSHGKDVKKVFSEAKERCPQKQSLVTKVPEKETMIF